MPSLTKREREAREALVLSLIEQGMNQPEIAEVLGVTQQSVSEFLRQRGWSVKKRGPVSPALAKRNERRRSKYAAARSEPKG